MPSRNSKQPAGCASEMVPSVTPARETRTAAALVFDSRFVRDERTHRALARRRGLVARATLAKKEDRASHARQPMRPCKRKTTTRDGAALAPAQTKRTEPHASPRCGITFDMSGIQRRTHCCRSGARPPAVVCPLDGGVSRAPARTEPAAAQHQKHLDRHSAGTARCRACSERALLAVRGLATPDTAAPPGLAHATTCTAARGTLLRQHGATGAKAMHRAGDDVGCIAHCCQS